MKNKWQSLGGNQMQAKTATAVISEMSRDKFDMPEHQQDSQSVWRGGGHSSMIQEEVDPSKKLTTKERVMFEECKEVYGNATDEKMHDLLL